MNNKGVAIRYGDVAPEAKENFVPTASEIKFDTLAQLQQYNLNFPNYANPCELYQTVLDGTASAFPSVPEQANLGLWSERVSNDDGLFVDNEGNEEPIVLTLTSEGQYSSQGFTLTFDTYNGIYCNHLNIKWYRNGEIIKDEEGKEQNKDFYPDNAFYFCHNQVKNYNKVVITFYSLNMPKNRLKLRVIDYGYGTFFYGNELRGVKLIQEIDPISTQISINTADFTLDSKRNIEYSFQEKQPLDIYFNGELKASTFVKKSNRKARFLWDIQSEDYIGMMDGVKFYGDMYEGKNAYELMSEIFNKAKVPYDIDKGLQSQTVSGLIQYSTCREALMQVAFATGCVVNTSNSNVVEVYFLGDDISQTIPLNRIKTGQSFSEESSVTGVTLTSHSYVKTNDFSAVMWGNDDEGNPTPNAIVGTEYIVNYSEPLHSVTLEGGTMLDSSVTHAHFIATSEYIYLGGKKYTHTQKEFIKKDKTLTLSSLENMVVIRNATLVNDNNVDNLLKKCYNWLIKTNTTNLKIVEGKHIQYGEPYKYGTGLKYGTGVKYGGRYPNIVTYDEPVNVGENIKAETEYLGVVSGRLIKQSFNLNGNIIIKEAVLK